MRQLYPRASRLRFFLVVAVMSVITLAASSPIYSAARGGHLIGHTSKSPAAAATGTAATADCSKAGAREVVERLGLSLNDPRDDPVGKVLCGSFTGPGSETMVVVLAGPTGPLDWVVFRWAGEEWQLLMRQSAGASITAAGSDIRQTVSVYRSNDSRCCPTGGTKTRIWHWNGTRFTVSPWKLVAKGKGEPSRFDSPSHNIHCSMFDGSGNDYSRGVGCNSDTPRRMVNMNADGRLTIRGIPKAWCGCKEPDFPRLGYGNQLTVGRFRCQSQQAGVTCTLIRSGKGFLISRAGVRRVG